MNTKFETTMERTLVDSDLGLSNTERHRLLASEQRRAAMDALRGHSAPVELTSLAASMAEGQDSVPDDSTLIGLHHTHLPRLAELGLIDYATETNRIEAIRF